MLERPHGPALASVPGRRSATRVAPGLDAFEDTRRSLALAWTLSQLWWGRAAGPAAVERAAQSRLDSLVRYARKHSALHRHAYRGIAPGPARLDCLPVMTKAQLMARFDDWVTDPVIRIDGVQRFLAGRSHVGERYLRRYVIWKSSGTSGEPGIYVQDDDALALYDALVAVQLTRADLAGPCLAGVLAHGGRAALVAATGDHFASVASWERVCRAAPGLAARGLSIMEPLDRLVAELNHYAPAFLASYPTMLALLADERSAGRLAIDPDLIWSGGEYLSPAGHAALERAFGCRVVNEYGASECLSIAFGCSEGWLHVNADWVLLEPVDRDFRPTPPGEMSHTVLLTNLANRVQPVIRYDLGDAVTALPRPCACGNPLPAIRVQGRRDDVVTLSGPSGREIRLLPMALTTVVEECAGLHHFQIVRRAADCLALRADPAETSPKPDAADIAARALKAYLDRQGACSVHVVVDPQPPQRDRASGKLRQVVAAD